MKWVILILFIVWIITTHRAFCSTGCPLGAIYGLFNRISLFRLSVDKDKCILCRKCEKTCPMNIKVYETPNHPDCIRCLECISACPVDAISKGIKLSGTEKTKD